jgi:hypothetical protein
MKRPLAPSNYPGFFAPQAISGIAVVVIFVIACGAK